MKATVARIVSPGNLEWEQESVEYLNPPMDSVGCVTLYSAISPGTEIAALQGAPPLRPGTGYPRVVGYCNVARVTAVGKGVRRFAPGDMVVSFASHRSHYVLPESKIVAKVPTGVLPEVACTAYLFHLGYQALLRAGVVAGHNVGILGLGALGLATTAMAALSGARVLGVSDHEEPRRIATGYGAEEVLSRDRCVTESIALFGDVGIDVLVTTSNAWSDWQLALDLVRPGGVISVLGFPGRTEGAPSFNPIASDRFYMKQMSLVSVGTAPSAELEAKDLRFTEQRNMAYLLELMKARRLDPAPIVSGVFHWQQLREAYEALADRRGSPITFVLRWTD